MSIAKPVGAMRSYLAKLLSGKAYFSLRETIKNVPLSSILLETDSPFLAPHPFRGKTNEPSNVKYIFEYLSEFFNVSLIELIKITNDNFYKLFSNAIRYNEISI